MLDDPELITWGQYAAKAWPTLAVVDPEGYVVASMAGEGHAEGLARLVDELVATHTARGTLHRGDGAYVPQPAEATTLRFPGKAVALPRGQLVVADSAHHSVVELDNDGQTVLRRFGSGQRGRADGPAHVARFSEPGGLCRCRRTRPRSPGTTWWSPTRSTISCAASTWLRARSPRSPARASHGAPLWT